jgi:hypothetical protein
VKNSNKKFAGKVHILRNTFPTAVKPKDSKSTVTKQETLATALGSLQLTIFTHTQQVANTHSHTPRTSYVPNAFYRFDKFHALRMLLLSQHDRNSGRYIPIFLPHIFRSNANRCNSAVPANFLQSLVAATIQLSCGYETAEVCFVFILTSLSVS